MFKSFRTSLTGKKKTRTSLPAIEQRRHSAPIENSTRLEHENARLRFTQTRLLASIEPDMRDKEITSLERQCNAERDRVAVIQAEILQEQAAAESLQRKSEEARKLSAGLLAPSNRFAFMTALEIHPRSV